MRTHVLTLYFNILVQHEGKEELYVSRLRLSPAIFPGSSAVTLKTHNIFLFYVSPPMIATS